MKDCFRNFIVGDMNDALHINKAANADKNKKYDNTHIFNLCINIQQSQNFLAWKSTTIDTLFLKIEVTMNAVLF